MRSKYIVIPVMLLSLILFGCSLLETTTKKIDEMVFKDVESVYVTDVSLQSKRLSDEEVLSLRKSIKNGIELESLNGDLPRLEPGVIYLIINKKNHFGINMAYEKRTGYMYIAKIDINWENKARYMTDRNLYKKYISGVYRFRPSSEINNVIAKYN